jgi:hypothetical protein
LPAKASAAMALVRAHQIDADEGGGGGAHATGHACSVNQHRNTDERHGDAGQHVEAFAPVVG